MLLMKLGYRNLWRNRRRTVLTMTAISVATTMVILMLGIYDGMFWDMIESATELYHGHVKITAEKYQDEHKIYMTLPEDGLRGKILADSRVKGVAGRVRGFALLSFGEGETSHTQPAELFGINPDEERTVTRLESHVREGSFISGTDSKDILLGIGLAKRLEAEVGGEIVAMGQGSDGSIAADIFHVSGIVDTGDPIRDVSLAVVGRKTLQDMLVLDGQIHEWAVSLKRPIAAEVWAREFRPEVPGVEVTSWYGFLPQMKQILDYWYAARYIFALIFYFAVVLVAVNTMYMMFFERLREFGIMGALGLRIRKLSFMIIIEGFLISSIAGIAGGIAGSLISLYMYGHPVDLSMFFSEITFGGTVMQPRLRCYLAVNNICVPVLMIIGLGMIVALFPAWRLKRLHPVDVLREV
ncbi:ABC transporter permease [bacterium]|nr:ABC transporter permease [bacterium]